MSSDSRVVIAGGGPNGLLLAIELAQAGVRPIVLERLPEPTVEYRANGMVGQIVRMLDRRGLYARLSADPRPPRPVPQFMFGALPLPLSTLDDNSLYTIAVPQRRIEEVFQERALELGVDLRRGHVLESFAQDESGVTVKVSGSDEIRADYLVGADGGHSLVRKLSGIGFPGVTSDDTVSRSAPVTVSPSVLAPGGSGLKLPGLGFVRALLPYRTDAGLFTFAMLPGRPPLISVSEWAATEGVESGPMPVDEFRAAVTRVLGVEVPFEPQETGPLIGRRNAGLNTRLAERYRDRRVFLVGDAAHVHSAAGGPGLNLGLQDAINLGWKLAATVLGTTPSGLLDTYESERRPVAERVVMHTQAQAALRRPGREVTALRELFGELLGEPVVQRHLADLLSGNDVRYDMGRAHDLVGRWCPDLTLRDGRRLAALTTAGRPLLLDRTGPLASVAAAWAERVDVVTADWDGPLTAVLLRPDCYIAWASSDPAPSIVELQEALTRWFGAALVPA